MKLGTVAFKIQLMIEACPGVGEARVLTWSFQMGATHAGMEMDSFSALLSSVCFSLPGFFSEPFPLGEIWWLGITDWNSLVLLVSQSLWGRDSSFLLTQYMKDLQWFQQVRVSVCSKLSEAILAEFRWIPLCLGNGQRLTCLDFVPGLLILLVLRVVFSGPFGLSLQLQ